MIKKITFLFFVTFPILSLFAQLPGDRVNVVVSDEYGCKWIGTDNGLLRKCGENWFAYTVQGDSAGTVTDIRLQQTSDGSTLWVSTLNGIQRIVYNDKEVVSSSRYTSVQTSFLSDVINSITIDKTGAIIFATPRGIGIFSNGNWSFMPEILDIFDNNFAVVAAKSDTILLGTVGEGVGRLVNTVDGYSGASSFMTPWQQLPGDNITCIFVDSKGNRWYGSDLGVSTHTKFESKEGWVDSFTSKLPDPYVTSIAEHKSGDIWVGTHGGLAIFNPGAAECKLISFPDGLPSSYITEVFCETDESVWIGTDKGLCHLIASEKVIYNTSEYLKNFTILK